MFSFSIVPIYFCVVASSDNFLCCFVFTSPSCECYGLLVFRLLLGLEKFWSHASKLGVSLYLPLYTSEIFPYSSFGYYFHNVSSFLIYVHECIYIHFRAIPVLWWLHFFNFTGLWIDFNLFLILFPCTCFRNWCASCALLFDDLSSSIALFLNWTEGSLWIFSHSYLILCFYRSL